MQENGTRVSPLELKDLENLFDGPVEIKWGRAVRSLR